MPFDEKRDREPKPISSVELSGLNKTMVETQMTFRMLEVAILAFGLGNVGHAAEFGTASDARAMLDKTIAAMKADPTGTIAAINSGQDGGFVDRDIYPFCGDASGKFVAHGANPSLVGADLRGLKDKTGRAIGEEFYSRADGEGSEYMWPRPGADTTPVPKVALLAQIGEYRCAVGYYK